MTDVNTNIETKKDGKTNLVAIYAYSVGLFILIIVSSTNSGIKLEWPQLVGLGFITVLLLFKYFDLIKLGGILELRRNVNSLRTEQKLFMASTADVVLSLKKDEKPKKIINEDSLPENPSKEQVEKCLELLRDPNWEYRTEKTLIAQSGMTQKQFKNFLNAHPDVVLARQIDVYGNKLYRLMR